MAGGGIKGGVTYGETDELGNQVVRDLVTIHDLHATILHLLGLDHEKLTYRFSGREQRLTDVHGEVVNQDPCLTEDTADALDSLSRSPSCRRRPSRADFFETKIRPSADRAVRVVPRGQGADGRNSTHFQGWSCIGLAS